MNRPAIAIVTGFTKSPELLARSFAPLRALKQKGVLDRILAVTWDAPGIDAYVAPILDMDGVELVRVPQPDVSGTRHQNGVVYQIRNLEAALVRVSEADALVLKLRPDFVADVEFLEDKIVNFERLCGPSRLHERLGVTMPASPFAMKVWVPWADANQPFFCEDAAFMGLKRDISQLASRDAEKYLDVLSDEACGWFAHVVRFIVPFLSSYPIFEPYVREFRYFPNDLDFRLVAIPELLTDEFFLHMLLASAWILATSFHVDSGAPGQLTLYTNTSNPDADWSRVETLKPNPPYDDLSTWRQGQEPGGVMPCVGRVFGRLVDDSWQHALFSESSLRDLSVLQIRGVLRNVSAYRRGALATAQGNFRRLLVRLYRQHWRGRTG